MNSCVTSRLWRLWMNTMRDSNRYLWSNYEMRLSRSSSARTWSTRLEIIMSQTRQKMWFKGQNFTIAVSNFSSFFLFKEVLSKTQVSRSRSQIYRRSSSSKTADRRLKFHDCGLKILVVLFLLWRTLGEDSALTIEVSNLMSFFFFSQECLATTNLERM